MSNTLQRCSVGYGEILSHDFILKDASITTIFDPTRRKKGDQYMYTHTYTYTHKRTNIITLILTFEHAMIFQLEIHIFILTKRFKFYTIIIFTIILLP